MIIDNLNVERASLFPAKADPPSLVDTDAVLTLPASFQSFEAVAGRRRQVPQNPCPVKIQQLSPRRPLKCLESCHGQIVKEVLGFFVSEGLDHNRSLLRQTSYVKHNTNGVCSRRLRPEAARVSRRMVAALNHFMTTTGKVAKTFSCGLS